MSDTVRHALAGYAKKGLNSHSHLTHNDDNSILLVITVVPGEHLSFLSLLARITDNIVIIERDQNDKPLVDALVQAGVPRSQIVLAYAGEAVPDAAV